MSYWRGQEINTGEAGLPEWFAALKSRFAHWRIYASGQLSDYEYTRGVSLSDLVDRKQLKEISSLHLAVSIRSYRAEKVSELVKNLLDNEQSKARNIYSNITIKYPIAVTRDLTKAKAWLRSKARGSERYGILANSGAQRLKAVGLSVQVSVDVTCWFLNGKEDVRSSYFLEDIATEFDVQGLELDWACIAWDADLRYQNNTWVSKKFRGTIWQNINDELRTLYLRNAYRVLLTRARQGMVVFIPEGNPDDDTRKPEYYDGTYNLLKNIGFTVL